LIKEHALFLEYKLNGLQFMTSEERYHKLVLDFPEILQKVSLTDIASYLGISRETLSRIRA
jgi:CRP-like cAMP-binding protein